MIKLNPDKEKTITFDLTVEGVDPKLLTYTLRLTENGIDYGFRGINNNGEIKVVIPPLNSVLNRDHINELKSIKLEVTGLDNKYYMKPYEDTVIIEQEPSVNISIKNEEEKIDEKTINVTVKDDNDNVVEKKKCKKSDKTPDKKKTKLSKIFN